MSKRAAIDIAVRLQFYSDSETPEYRTPMETAVAGSRAAYTSARIQRFLIEVSKRLRLDVPSLSFAWKNLKLADCLSATLLTLEELIEAETT
ncbi:MAG: hypothetical protein ACHQRJ_11320 [Alphaproteobacteria bacterium]